jgi:hypothetical protein
LESVAVVALAGVLTTGCAFTGAGVDRDEHGFAQVHARLAGVLPDLDAVTDPANAHAQSPAKFTGCFVDNDGDLYQPQAHREWTLGGPARASDELQVTPRGRQAGSAIARQLVARGWTGSTELDDYAGTDLSRSFDGYTVHLGLQAFNDVVNVWATTTPRKVCTTS